MKPYSNYVLILLLVTCLSCRTEKKESTSRPVDQPMAISSLKTNTPADEEDILGIWRFPGTEDPPMEMIFGPDHTVVFKDGYTFYNPATWAYDKSTAELALSIPKLSDEQLTNLEQWWVGRGMERVDRKNKVVYIRFEKGTERFCFSGYWYDKQ